MTHGYELVTRAEVHRRAWAKNTDGRFEQANIFVRLIRTRGGEDYIISTDTDAPAGFRYVGTLGEEREEAFYE